MQRSRLTTVLSSLGLAAACARADTSSVNPEPKPALTPESSLGVEPSGRGLAPKSMTPSTPTAREPHFEGVPTAFCQATLERRDQPLLRTASFLEIWNELAPTVRNRLAHNIPSSEIDARFYLCGSERCTVDAPRVAEVTADYMVGVGVLIPDGGELLVVPDAVADHPSGSCTNDAATVVERHGDFIHVRAISHERRYVYARFHGYGYEYEYEAGGNAYEPIPPECRTYSTIWRDLVIDASTGELELTIDQVQPESITEPQVSLSFEEPGIVLFGCGSALELTWTE